MTTTSPKLQVLLVDDDSDFLWQQKVQLEAAGFDVVTAVGESEAKRKLAERHPDLAVIDVMMDNPDTGFTLCYHIRKLAASIPLILVTSIVSETGLDSRRRPIGQADSIRATSKRNRPTAAGQYDDDGDGSCGFLTWKYSVMDILRVLVTDDELGMRLGVARTLRDFTVSAAAAGRPVGWPIACLRRGRRTQLDTHRRDAKARDGSAGRDAYRIRFAKRGQDPFAGQATTLEATFALNSIASVSLSAFVQI